MHDVRAGARTQGRYRAHPHVLRPRLLLAQESGEQPHVLKADATGIVARTWCQDGRIATAQHHQLDGRAQPRREAKRHNSYECVLLVKLWPPILRGPRNAQGHLLPRI